MVSALILLAVSFGIFAFSQDGKKKNGLIKILIFLSLLGVLTYYFSDAIQFFDQNTKIGLGFEDEARFLMIKEYSEKLDLWSFFIGANYDGTIINVYFDGNPHNSFIRGHHWFGIVYIVAILWVTGMALLSHPDWRTRCVAISLIAVMLFRSFTEPILFPTPLDFYYFITVFMFIRSSSMRNFQGSNF